MFNNPPLILAHKSSCNNGNFVTEDYIIVNDQGEYSLKDRACPHRAYLMHNTGDVVKQIECDGYDLLQTLNSVYKIEFIK
jgi:hypothetical protein